MTGEIPSTVELVENVLKVQKVDESVNTTFVCEVNNKIGTTKEQFGILVRGELSITDQRSMPKLGTCLSGLYILNVIFQHRVTFLGGNNLICALPCDIMN